MTLRNSYNIVDDQIFSENSLAPSEVAVKVEPRFTERDNAGSPVIELLLKLVWSSDEENEQHYDKVFKWAIFFGAKNAQTVQILLNLFRKGGFQTNTWIVDSDTPAREMLPGALKLLAYKGVVLKGKIVAGTKADNPRNFFNATAISRSNPETGEEYDDALPDPVPNELVLEALHAELGGENTSATMV